MLVVPEAELNQACEAELWVKSHQSQWVDTFKSWLLKKESL
jgi:hypothetical protein